LLFLGNFSKNPQKIGQIAKIYAHAASVYGASARQLGR
jgi:hypothetical protein